MATYPNVNAANQYARDVVNGKILACRLTILSCQRHLDDLERAKDPNWPYRFDKNKAERFLRFSQKMPHTSGEWARRKLRIEFEPWQKFSLGVPFGWVRKDTGFRRFTEIYIEVPRKNGKSAIAAAIGNYMFCADGEYAAEVYCGATTEKQAWKVFAPALAMVKKLPSLRQKFSIKPWAKRMTRPDGSVFAPIIGDPGDGDSPSCAIIDEYHEHDTDALYTTMTTGIRGELGSTYRQLEREGIVENFDLFQKHLIVERNQNDPNRLDVLFPPDYVNQLRVFAVLNQFRLQYNEETA
ncbi:TPA: hypothetical protein I8243_001598 [Citrobacter freundii]|nr:hypothetical protein [Citrobacter freundii]NTY70600.1 hypothetical protein [Citrobacter freundii]QLX58650.1 hypothetical protein HV167_09840 [Citrobacter freundii]QLX64078.1 hypothetical protein HV171_14070 [Citrobacter freundii]HAT2188692.1 hypothetical protein [Citrobacter freundii]